MRRAALLFSLALAAAACGAPGGAPTPSPVQAPVGGYPGWPPNVTSDLIPYPVSTEIVVVTEVPAFGWEWASVRVPASSVPPGVPATRAWKIRSSPS